MGHLYFIKTWMLTQLKFIDKHLCKSPPTQQKFYLTATKPRDEYVLDLSVKIFTDREEVGDLHLVTLHPITVTEIQVRFEEK